MSVDLGPHILQGKGGKELIMPSDLALIGEAVSFMDKVLYSEECYYSEQISRNGQHIREISALGTHMKYLLAYVRLQYAGNYAWPPEVKFLFAQFSKHPINELNNFSCIEKADIALFDDFLETVRKEAIKCNLKAKVHNWKSKPAANSDSLLKLEAELFELSETLLPLSFEFRYHIDPMEPEVLDLLVKQYSSIQEQIYSGTVCLAASPVRTKGVKHIHLGMVQADRSRLIGNLKGKLSLFRDLVGYVWQIKWDGATGYYLRAVFFYEGACARDAQSLLQGIADYWGTNITESRGYAQATNLMKPNIFGPINRDSVITREKLHHQLLCTFCASNYLVQIIPFPHARLFDSGFGPFYRKTARRGEFVCRPDHQR